MNSSYFIRQAINLLKLDGSEESNEAGKYLRKALSWSIINELNKESRNELQTCIRSESLQESEA